MKYKGIELQEFKSDKPVVFDPPKKMLVWDDWTDGFQQELVIAYLPSWDFPALINNLAWRHCAEIPEEPKPRRATNNELAKWLAQGNGQFANVKSTYFLTELGVLEADEDKPCDPYWRIRKWDDKEWHEPTADYMGLEAK